MTPQALSCAYAEHLVAQQQPEQAGLLLWRCGEPGRALQAFVSASSWRHALCVAQQVPLPPDQLALLARDMAGSPRPRPRPPSPGSRLAALLQTDANRSPVSRLAALIQTDANRSPVSRLAALIQTDANRSPVSRLAALLQTDANR